MVEILTAVITVIGFAVMTGLTIVVLIALLGAFVTR